MNNHYAASGAIGNGHEEYAEVWHDKLALRRGVGGAVYTAAYNVVDVNLTVVGTGDVDDSAG